MQCKCITQAAVQTGCLGVIGKLMALYDMYYQIVYGLGLLDCCTEIKWMLPCLQTSVIHSGPILKNMERQMRGIKQLS